MFCWWRSCRSVVMKRSNASEATVSRSPLLIVDHPRSCAVETWWPTNKVGGGAGTPWSSGMRTREGRTSVKLVAGCVLQHRLDLSAGHPGEPFEKLLDGSPLLEVLEESFDRDPCTSEGPRSADPVGISLHSVTASPIQHAQTVPLWAEPDKLPG